MLGCRPAFPSMMLEVGGQEYASAGVVCAAPRGQRVRVKFADGTTFDCLMERMLSIV